MTWEYRVMTNGGELAIYEVYYYEDGKIQGYSSAPVCPRGETIDELTTNCSLYLKALSLPILEYEQ